jgi:hypothetical protein
MAIEIDDRYLKGYKKIGLRYGQRVPGPPVEWWLGSGVVAPSTGYTVYDFAVAATEADALVNVVNPGVRNAVKNGTVTFTQGVGFTGNGTDGYLNTQTTISENTTVIAMYRDSQSGRYLFGVLQASPNRTMSIVAQSSTNVGWEIGQNFVSSASRHLGGTIAATMQRAYRNGVRDTTINTSWPGGGGVTSRTLKLFAYDNGTVSSFNSATIHRVAIYNTILSDAQIKAVHDDMIQIGDGTYDSSYGNKVLSLNPSLYVPCNVKNGYVYFKDLGPNNIVINYTNAGQWSGGISGKYGTAIESPSPTATTQFFPNINTGYNNLRDFDLDECTISMWVNLSYSAPFNQKLIEIWRTGLSEYIAYEIRATNQYGFFTRTNGVDQNDSNLFSGGSGWNHVVMYNSVSNGVVGMWYNGTKYNFTKTLGATVTRTNGLLEIGAIIGAVQHVALYPRLLSDSEILSLL